MVELLTLAGFGLCVFGLLARLFYLSLKIGVADRVRFAEERKAWADERSILITRIQDPIAGMSQAYAQMEQPATPDPNVVPDHRF